jgi:hypothetical protein
MEGGRKSGVHDRVHANAERAIAAIFGLEGVSGVTSLGFPKMT